MRGISRSLSIETLVGDERARAVKVKVIQPNFAVNKKIRKRQ